MTTKTSYNSCFASFLETIVYGILGIPAHSRVVRVDVDMVQRGLLEAENVNHRAVQDVAGLGKELVEPPALLLVRF